MGVLLLVVGFYLRLFIVSSARSPSSSLVPAQRLDLSGPRLTDLVESEFLVVDEEDLCLDLETLVVDHDTGGLSYIKVGGAAPSAIEPAPLVAYDLAAGIAASLAQAKKDNSENCYAESILQSTLSKLEPNALLDKATPRDGHCLFHALKPGLSSLTDIKGQLTVAELRCFVRIVIWFHDRAEPVCDWIPILLRFCISILLRFWISIVPRC